MIGIAQDDVGTGGADIGRLHRLDGGGGSDRHERRRPNLAAPHRDGAGPGGAVGVGDREGEAGGVGHGRAPYTKAVYDKPSPFRSLQGEGLQGTT